MRRRLCLLLLPLMLAVSPISKLSSSIFKLAAWTPNGIEVGTGFCAPGKTNIIITASHAVMPGLVVFNSKNEPFKDPKVLLNDPKRDVALLMLDSAPCTFSPSEFALKDATPGDDLWLEGWGGVFEKRVTTRGIAASEVGYGERFPGFQLAQLNALYGHSGSPVVGADGKIEGMLVGVYDDKGDQLDVIVPVSVLKRALK